MGGAIALLLVGLTGLLPVPKAPEPIEPAAPGHVLAGTWYLGPLAGEGWGPREGAMVDQGGITVIPGNSDLPLPEGYHDGSGVVRGDEELLSENIRCGSNIFGVEGAMEVVNTESGDAQALDISAGRKAWVDGVEISGEAAGARVPRTGQESSHGPGDDGELRRGAALPRPRFTKGNDGTVTDRSSGLVWLENATCVGTAGEEGNGGRVTWSRALELVAALNKGELDCGVEQQDWRLPSIRELSALVHYGYSYPPLSNLDGGGQWSDGDPFTGVFADMYWSSTSAAGKDGDAWYLDLTYGRQGVITKLTEYYVWPVRGGE